MLDFKNNELKYELQKIGLKTTGKKEALISRLENYYPKKNSNKQTMSGNVEPPRKRQRLTKKSKT